MAGSPEISFLPSPQKVIYVDRVLDLAGKKICLQGFESDEVFRLLENGQYLKVRDHFVRVPAASDITCELIEAEVEHAEGYELHIGQRIVIRARQKAGILNGVKTLLQILLQCADSLPMLDIVDYPDFKHRGVMLDISRDRVPLQSELLQIVDMLSAWKINHLQLYTEHTFAYFGHETVWGSADPLTSDEIRELDAHCRKRGITLAANQNCFGHMERWLKHPEYQHLAEVTGKWDFNGVEKSGPFSLCPTDPGSIELIRDLLGQLLPNFSSKLVNIGCDETFDVGQGRSAQAILDRGFSSVYFEFVRQVTAIARGQGFKPMFWADIALSHPASIGMIPDDMVCLAWGYEPDSPFEQWCEALSNRQLETWLCPGTSSWRSITGRTTERKANISEAAFAGKAYRSEGFLVTDWGDLGHRQQLPVSGRGLMDGACAAWNASESEYRHSSETLNWLDELGDADLELRKISGIKTRGGATHLKNASALFNDMHLPSFDNEHELSIQQWESVQEKFSQLEGSFLATVDFPYLWGNVGAELRHTLKLAQFACARAIARRSEGGLQSADSGKLIDQLEDIVSKHSQLWQARSRLGGLSDSVKWYEDLKSELAGS